MVQSYEQGWEAAMEQVRRVISDNFPHLHRAGRTPFDDGWNACCQALAAHLGLSLTAPGPMQGWGDLAQQDAARDLLRHTMSRISEERWCAGWLVDLEYVLWRDVLDYQQSMVPPRWGYHDDGRDLAFLAAVGGGWWIFSDDAKNEVFVPLDEWRPLYRAWEEKRAQQHQE